MAGIENSACLVTAPVKEFGILHLCPINLPRERLEVIMDNIRLYTQRVHEDGTIHVDAIYNSLSFLNQLLARIDRIKMAYFPEYVEVIQYLWSIGDDVHLEAKGEEFTLTPGNVTRGHGEQRPRTINTQECLLCRHQHYANECYSRVIMVKQNFQTTSPDNSFKARRVDNFMMPRERDRAVFYSEPMYIRQDGVIQTGNAMRKDNRHMKTQTTYATVTKEGRFTPYIPEEKKNKPKKVHKLALLQPTTPDEFFEGEYTPGNPDEHVPEELRTPSTPVAGPSNPEPVQTRPSFSANVESSDEEGNTSGTSEEFVDAEQSAELEYIEQEQPEEMEQNQDESSSSSED
ncbi:hypothetical protein JOM56_003792 [Amanita muscaria]